MLDSSPTSSRTTATPSGATEALVAASLALVVLTTVAAGAVDRFDAARFAWTTLAHGALYSLCVVWLIRRAGTPAAAPVSIALVLVVALVLRAIAMTTEPGITTDAYRYVWDGRLMLSGVSPYLHIPADPALAAFRDPAVFPHINQRETAFTIYPPVAQLIFAAGAALDPLVGSGRDAGHNGMKLVMLAFEALTVWALLGWLDSEKLPRDRVLIYAWHPVTVWEFAGQAHIDAAATALLVTAILAAVRRRQALAGGLLAAAALVKYFPLALLPALWHRWTWRMPAAFAAVALALYLPHLVTAGPKVIGFIASHLGNEGYRDGWGFHPVWLVRDLGIGDLSGSTYAALALAVMAWLAFIVLFARTEAEIRPAHLVLLAAAFIWLTSSHYPWYFGWLVPLTAVYPHPGAIAMTLGAMALHLPRPPGGPTWSGLYLAAYWLPALISLGWTLWTVPASRWAAIWNRIASRRA